MKKTLIFALIAAFIIPAMCFGEVLTTGLANNEGDFSVQGFYSSTPIKAADSSISVFGPKLIYGVTKDLDIFGKYGMGSLAGVSATVFGIGAKYNFLKISNNDPVDLAGIIANDTSSTKDFTWGMLTFGVVMSKMVREKFTLYGTICALQNSAKYTGFPSSSSSALMFGVGAKYQMSKKISFLGEITSFSADSETYQTFSIAGQYEM